MKYISLQLTHNTFKIARVKGWNNSKEKLSQKTKKQMALFPNDLKKKTFFWLLLGL